MPLPRKSLVSLEATPYYHCVSRCVRRAFLCGEDTVTGRSYEHRRAWIEARMLALAEVFALDLCAYAVMHNHYHVVLHVDRDAAAEWSDREVIERWHRLFAGSLYSQRYLAGDGLLAVERQVLDEQVAEWRRRLADISWFMRCLNESIAREANREDECTGRFWEGRFKSQALLDDKALAACLAYVDLNPIRAGITEKPETSDYTAVKRRITKAQSAAQPNHPCQQPAGLLPFAGNPREAMPRGLPFRLTDYLELMEWTGRQIRDDKRGAITEDLPAILTRLQIEPEQWCNLTTRFESRFKYLVGGVQAIRRACREINRNWVHGVSNSRALLESG
jgi:REP element-mobilizing transposase RayT